MNKKYLGYELIIGFSISLLMWEAYTTGLSFPGALLFTVALSGKIVSNWLDAEITDEKLDKLITDVSVVQGKVNLLQQAQGVRHQFGKPG